MLQKAAIFGTMCTFPVYGDVTAAAAVTNEKDNPAYELKPFSLQTGYASEMTEQGLTAAVTASVDEGAVGTGLLLAQEFGGHADCMFVTGDVSEVIPAGAMGLFESVQVQIREEYDHDHRLSHRTHHACSPKERARSAPAMSTTKK